MTNSNLKTSTNWSKIIYHTSFTEKIECSHCNSQSMNEFPLPFCAKTILGALISLQNPIRSDCSCLIPMIISHEYRLFICLPPLIQNFDMTLADESSDYANCFFLAVLLLIKPIEKYSISRELIKEYLEIFITLLRCSERLQLTFRRKAQSSFIQFLDLFVHSAQYLLISHLFDIVSGKKVIIKDDLNEPQLLGWMVDQYRQKAFSNKERFDCRIFFQCQLSKFYSKLESITYEDLILSMNFYHATLLLISAHAMYRIQPQLLNDIKVRILNKYSAQISDFKQLVEFKNRTKIKQNQIENCISNSIHSVPCHYSDEETITKLQFLTITMRETTQRVHEASQTQ